MTTWTNLYFQDSASPNMENLIMFHDFTMMFMVMITLLISMNMFFLLINNKYFTKFMNNQLLELTWTITPMLILMDISIPSIMNLYNNEFFHNPMITIKIIANQWFWTFEYSDTNSIEFDSFMIKKNLIFDFIYLETDNNLIIPFNCMIRFIITSNDVIHSFSIPSMGLKIDACPGRLNQINVNCLRPGMFFGQCSEICGINHSFMPISIESIETKMFLFWMTNFN